MAASSAIRTRRAKGSRRNEREPRRQTMAGDGRATAASVLPDLLVAPAFFFERFVLVVGDVR